MRDSERRGHDFAARLAAAALLCGSQGFGPTFEELKALGGAVFVDAGRAWHGTGERSAGERTLTDAGLGLQLQNPRSSSGSVVHVDLAFPVNARDAVKSVQVLFKSYAIF